MCAAAPLNASQAEKAAAPRSRGKVPSRPEYVVDEEYAGARRLARIIPHGPDACIDSGLASGYLNQPAVMAAIHVRDPGFCWAVCNTAPGWKYTSTRTNLPANTYPLLVGSLRVVIFNGDWDACQSLEASHSCHSYHSCIFTQVCPTRTERAGPRAWASPSRALGTHGPTPPPRATPTKVNNRH